MLVDAGSRTCASREGGEPRVHQRLDAGSGCENYVVSANVTATEPEAAPVDESKTDAVASSVAAAVAKAAGVSLAAASPAGRAVSELVAAFAAVARRGEHHAQHTSTPDEGGDGRARIRARRGGGGVLLDERLISAGEASPAPSARGNPSVVKRNAAHFAAPPSSTREARPRTSRAEREGRGDRVERQPTFSASGLDSRCAVSRRAASRVVIHNTKTFFFATKVFPAPSGDRSRFGSLGSLGSARLPRPSRSPFRSDPFRLGFLPRSSDDVRSPRTRDPAASTFSATVSMSLCLVSTRFRPHMRRQRRVLQPPQRRVRLGRFRVLHVQSRARYDVLRRGRRRAPS